MKTSLTLLALVIPAGLVLAPLPIEVATSVLFVAGLLGLALYDYTHMGHARAAAPALSGSVRRHRNRLEQIA